MLLLTLCALLLRRVSGIFAPHEMKPTSHVAMQTRLHSGKAPLERSLQILSCCTVLYSFWGLVGIHIFYTAGCFVCFVFKACSGAQEFYCSTCEIGILASLKKSSEE